ncbi:type II toxin-antitoxin system RelE/ParE family toxin [Rhodopseudomonas sp. WA056]|uniref:type II toxin-antitoxin system RelE/ParE family toxin n=1 Tax=Rhodopseudomonas sp. WA056 TaxID=2269367 RepID=UPI0013DEB6B2|nr:type II toxin-antitoxin system RelE/ParE family toxin [Rhodopseudomonas sp. WA056]
MKLVWSDTAIADLERFAEFLRDNHPAIASRIAPEIVKQARLIADYPRIGRPGPGGYRELNLPVLNAVYVLRYTFDGERILMLRVFHSREQRDP